MKKFYQTESFRSLEATWRAVLKRDRFLDIEPRSGMLKKKDQRTIAFRNRERIRTFYLMLDDVLRKERLAKWERRILRLFVQGIPQEGRDGITSKLQIGRSSVHEVVCKYRQIVQGKVYQSRYSRTQRPRSFR